MFILLIDRGRWQQEKKKWREGGRKGEHFLHPLFSSDELIM